MKTEPFRVAVLAAFALASSMPFAQEIADESALRAILEKRLAAEEKPACAIAGIASEKTIIARACSPGASAPTLLPGSFVEIGSISKAITGLLLADLVERGEASLDDAAASLAPKDAKLPRGSEREIRLRDLVTHTSGLPRLPPDFRPKDGENPYADYGTDALYASLALTPLAREPGKGYEYSNLGFQWLSDLLSRRAGRDLEALAKERVFAPLGMKEAAVRLGPDSLARLAKGHDENRRPAKPWDFQPALSGVGGFRVTTEEMMRLAEALAGRRASPLDAAIRRSQERLFANPRGGGVAYAWVIVPRPEGAVYWHNGGTGGFRTMLAFAPGAKRAAFVASDSTIALDDLGLHLADPGLPLKQKRVAVTLEEAVLEEYVGRYELRPEFVIAITREGTRLYTQATGQSRFEVFAEGRDRLFARVVDAQLLIRRGADGKVEGLTLVQGGRSTPARRLP